MGGESDPGSIQEKPWWMPDKSAAMVAFRERFKVAYKVFNIGEGQDKPLPPWTEQDIADFASSDPVYGQQLASVRQAAIAGFLGAMAGGVVSGGFAYRQSRSLVGTAALGALGAAVGWGLTGEVTNLTFGLNKFDPLEANLKFLEWWKNKSA